MSLTTTIIRKKDGKQISFITEQYEVGLYVAVYTKGEQIPLQCSSQLSETAYHRKQRRICAKLGDKFLQEESDPLNRGKIQMTQIEFAKQYCEKKGWPWVECMHIVRLPGEQIREIHAQPEWQALNT